MVALALVVLGAILMAVIPNCKLHTRSIAWVALQGPFPPAGCVDHGSEHETSLLFSPWT